MLESLVRSIASKRCSRFVLPLLLSCFLMSFSSSATAQQSTKEQRKERRAAQRAAAEQKRQAALFEDADFHDEEDYIAIEVDSPAPRKKAKKKRRSSSKTKEDVHSPAPSIILTTEQEIEQYAHSLKGIPYRYGGTDKKGFDCSGFSYHVFAESGVSIPRTAQAQYDAAQIIPLRKAKKGDLIFFGKSKRKISHVGIVISKKGEPLRMIHSASSGGIMYTDIDSSDYWQSRLHSAGRYLSDTAMR